MDFIIITPQTTPQELNSMGVVPDSKIDSQILMYQLGLPIPESLVFSSQAFEIKATRTSLKPIISAQLKKWINRYSHKSFQIRCDGRFLTSNSQTIRNQPTLQDLAPSQVIAELESLFSGLPPNRLAIVQSIPEKSLERDLHSAQYCFHPHTHFVTFEIRHDIATILAREGGLPDETINFHLTELLSLTPHQLVSDLINRRKILPTPQLLHNFHHTLMRFGRLEIQRVTGIKIPKIETLLSFEIHQTLRATKIIDKHSLQKLITSSQAEIQAFQASGDSLKNYDLPGTISLSLTLGNFLTILGFFNLGNFTHLRPEYDQYHTMKIRLHRLLAKKDLAGYLSPTPADYLQIFQDAKRLAQNNILQQSRMPKFSIVNTPTGHEFIYWDLIPSGY